MTNQPLKCVVFGQNLGSIAQPVDTTLGGRIILLHLKWTAGRQGNKFSGYNYEPRFDVQPVGDERHLAKATERQRVLRQKFTGPVEKNK